MFFKRNHHYSNVNRFDLRISLAKHSHPTRDDLTIEISIGLMTNDMKHIVDLFVDAESIVKPVDIDR